MDIKKVLTMSHKILSNASIPHALIGGLALGFHNVHRFTNDVDFLVGNENRLELKKAFLSHGFQIAAETSEVIHLTGLGFVDILFASRQLSQAVIKNAEIIPGLKIPCCSVEDIIGLKIQAYKNSTNREYQDKADIQALIERHEKTIKWKKIKEYAQLFDEWDTVQEIRKKVSS